MRSPSRMALRRIRTLPRWSKVLIAGSSRLAQSRTGKGYFAMRTSGRVDARLPERAMREWPPRKSIFVRLGAWSGYRSLRLTGAHARKRRRSSIALCKHRLRTRHSEHRRGDQPRNGGSQFAYRRVRACLVRVFCLPPRMATEAGADVSPAALRDGVGTATIRGSVAGQPGAAGPLDTLPQGADLSQGRKPGHHDDSSFRVANRSRDHVGIRQDHLVGAVHKLCSRSEPWVVRM